jgi:hypothetical protein
MDTLANKIRSLVANQSTLCSTSDRSHEVDDFMKDIERLFIQKFHDDPALKTSDPNRIWRSIQQFVRSEVKELLQKKYSMQKMVKTTNAIN